MNNVNYPNIAVGGTCQKIAISSTSAQSAAIPNVVHITPSVDCFVREAANPVALADGTDHFLSAGATQEFQVKNGNKLAFITTAATGTVYIAAVA